MSALHLVPFMTLKFKLWKIETLERVHLSKLENILKSNFANPAKFFKFFEMYIQFLNIT